MSKNFAESIISLCLLYDVLKVIICYINTCAHIPKGHAVSVSFSKVHERCINTHGLARVMHTLFTGTVSYQNCPCACLYSKHTK